MLFLKHFSKFLFSPVMPIAFAVCTLMFTLYAHVLLSEPKSSVPLKEMHLPHLVILPAIATNLMPANKLVQVCGELNLENLFGLKLIFEEEVCGWAGWAHVCVIGTSLLKLPPSSEILCPLTLGQAFQVPFSPFFPAPFPSICVSHLLSPLVYNVPVTKELRVTHRAQSVGPAWQLTLSCTGKVEGTLAGVTVSSNAWQ